MLRVRKDSFRKKPGTRCERNPRDPLAFDLAGAALMQSGDYAEATIAFRKGLLLAPESEWLRELRGRPRPAGDSLAARMGLGRTLERAPDGDVELYGRYRDAAIETGDAEAA